MANSRKNKTARPAFDAAAWVNENPTAAPSKGQIFAMLMPSKGGLNTGSLRATEAAAKLEAMNLACWTRKGLSQVNDAIRSSKDRREAGQVWLTGLLTTKEVVKTVEVPEVEEVAVVFDDTSLIGSAGSTSASRQTQMTGGAVHDAAVGLRDLVLERFSGDDLSSAGVMRDGAVVATLDELDEPRSDIRLWLNALHPLELSENQPRD